MVSQLGESSIKNILLNELIISWSNIGLIRSSFHIAHSILLKLFFMLRVNCELFCQNPGEYTNFDTLMVKCYLFFAEFNFIRIFCCVVFLCVDFLLITLVNHLPAGYFSNTTFILFFVIANRVITYRHIIIRVLAIVIFKANTFCS